jgi:hypothetical protein
MIPVFANMIREILAPFLFHPGYCEVMRPLFYPTFALSVPPAGILILS